MADQPEILQDEHEYWRSSREFVRVLIAELNQSLKASGIWKRHRIQICKSFLFSLTNLFDQQWMKVDGQTQYPLLCFAKVFPDLDTSLVEISPVNFPHKSVELHAMVGDEIDWYFGEMRERSGAVLTGDVGAETPDTEPPPRPDLVRHTSPCQACRGTGQCFCLRKGAVSAAGCPRCRGSGRCSHCHGSGIWSHPEDRRES